MINFEEIVLSYLEESASSGDYDNLHKFVEESIVVDYINIEFKKCYSWFNVTQDQLKGIIDLMGRQIQFTTPTAKTFVDYRDFFPILDMFAYLSQDWGANKTKAFLSETVIPDKKITLTKYDTFIGLGSANSLLKRTNAVDADPLFDYTPSSSWAIALQGPLKRAIAQEKFGKIALDKFKDESIKKTIYGLLEVRKNIRVSHIKNPRNVPNAVSYIDKILFNPKQFVGGQTKVPVQFKSIYNSNVIDSLIDIAITAEELYETQLKEMLPASEINPPKTTLQEFLENKTIQTYTASPDGAPGVIEGGNFFCFKGKTSDSKQTTVANNGPGEKGYIIENIKQMRSNAAQELIKKLTSFANYISEGEPRNLAGKLQATASALKSVESALGIKM